MKNRKKSPKVKSTIYHFKINLTLAMLFNIYISCIENCESFGRVTDKEWPIAGQG